MSAGLEGRWRDVMGVICVKDAGGEVLVELGWSGEGGVWRVYREAAE